MPAAKDFISARLPPAALWHTDCHIFLPLTPLQGGRDVYDLGETLYSFFLRYGEEFDYEVHAVSVRSGGIVPKRLLPFAMDSARFAASTQAYYHNAVSWHERLCVDCPVTGEPPAALLHPAVGNWKGPHALLGATK